MVEELSYNAILHNIIDTLDGSVNTNDYIVTGVLDMGKSGELTY